MTRKKFCLPLVFGAVFLSLFFYALPAVAAECDDAWDACMKRCTKKALSADVEEFKAFLSMDNECDATCDAKAAKCYKAAAGKEKSKVTKVLKQRAKVYAKTCNRRYEKILDKCKKSGDDLKAFKSCYKKRLRPQLLECYAEIDRDLPLPGASSD